MVIAVLLRAAAGAGRWRLGAAGGSTAVGLRRAARRPGAALLTRDSYYLDVATTILRNLHADHELAASGEHRPDQHGPHLVHGDRRLRVRAPGDAGRAVLLGDALVVAPLVAALAVPIGQRRPAGERPVLLPRSRSPSRRWCGSSSTTSSRGSSAAPRASSGFRQPDRLLGLAFTGKLALYGLMAVLCLGGRARARPPGVLALRPHGRRHPPGRSAGRDAGRERLPLQADAVRARERSWPGSPASSSPTSAPVLHSSDFGLEPMVLLVVFTVIGGTGSVWGPVVGTILMTIASELCASSTTTRSSSSAPC